MLSKNLKLSIVFVFVLLLGKVSFGQDSTNTNEYQHHMDMKDHNMMNHNMTNHKMMDLTMTDMKDKNSIVREGVIDLQAIDENGDGKVFQDVMDWNVISDKAGYCPLCEMQLKEVSLETAKKNLEKFGYKVK